MAIFGKEGKKLSLDEILKGIDNLPEEDKMKVHEKMKDLYKAEDEREIDKIEREKADDNDKADEKFEDEKEESEEIGKDVDEVEEKFEENKDEKEDVLKSHNDRIAALEEKLNKYDGLFAKMEEINKKHEDDIGYKSKTPSEKKSYGDMSSKELAAELKSEI